MKVLLDTNFILTCIKQKIDFLSAPYEFLLPEEVLDELKIISKRKGEKIKDKSAAGIALIVIKDLDKVRLDNKNVDKGIIEYAKNHKDIVVATLDAEIKEKIGKSMVIKNKKNLAIE
jgi:rRNA-processing protein FCF1